MNWLRESVTYHMILDEGREEGREDGRLEGERRLLVRMGTATFGSPSPAVIATIEAISDSQRLEQLGVALLAGASQD